VVTSGATGLVWGFVKNVIGQQCVEYPSAFRAGGKHDPDSPTFKELMNGEHGDEYREEMSIEMTSLQKAAIWNILQRS